MGVLKLLQQLVRMLFTPEENLRFLVTEGTQPRIRGSYLFYLAK